MKTFSTCLLPLISLLLASTGTDGATQEKADTRPLHAASKGQGIRAAYEAARHRLQPAGDGWDAHNPGQRWTTHFDRQGFTAKPQEGSWTWGLQLQGYGFGEAQTTVTGTPAVEANGQRLGYQWDDNVEEWFINDQRGLEHGFTVSRRPASGNAPAGSGLTFTLLTRGDLSPRVAPQAVGFHDASGAFVLNYSGLKVWDADGVILPSRFEVAEGSNFRLVVDEQGARYPITIDPLAQQAYVKASNPEAGDEFGYAVDISGTTMVIGAPKEDSNATGVNGNQADNSAPDSGAVYVFVRNGDNWTQEAYLKASNTGSGDQFGCSVAIDGDTIVVGALMEDSSAKGVGGNQADDATQNSGAAYVFIRTAGVWSQQAYVKATDGTPEDSFGNAVAISGDRIVVGASRKDYIEEVEDVGAAYVFKRSSGAWSVEAMLNDSFIRPSMFGNAVAIENDTVAIGAKHYGLAGAITHERAGAAYVFAYNGSTWSRQALIYEPDWQYHNAQFGYSLALSGDHLAVGASIESWIGDYPNVTTRTHGCVFFYRRENGVWTKYVANPPETRLYSPTGADRGFGKSLAMEGNTLLVGSSPTLEDGLTMGEVFGYTRIDTQWFLNDKLHVSAVETTDNYGVAVAISDRWCVVGASLEDSNATGTGGNQADNSALDAGAAYTFALPPKVIPSTANLSMGPISLIISGTQFSTIPSENILSFTPSGTGTVTAATKTTLTVTGLTGLTSGPLSAVVVSSGISSGAPATVATVLSNSVPTDIYHVVSGTPPEVGSTIWGPVTKFDNTPSQVSTVGTHHSAVRFAAADLAVNGVTFSRHVGGGVFANNSQIFTTNATVASGGSGGSGNYGALVSSAGFHSNPNIGSISIGGLTKGGLYQVQLFMPYWDRPWSARFVSPGGAAVVQQCGVAGTSHPDLVTGIFLAGGNQHAISWLPHSSFAMLAAVSVRKLDNPFAFTENNPPGAAIADFVAADDDVGQTYTFSLVPGEGDDDNASFSLTGKTLKILSTADFETKPTYSIRVQVQDSAGGVFSKAFTVTVVDIPDFAEISVEHPLATSLTNVMSSIDFGARPLGNSSQNKLLTIRNLGNVNLILGTPLTRGGHAVDFSLSTADLALTVPPAGETTFGVVFTPSSGGARSTTLSFATNDDDESPFSITLTGTGLLEANDTDSDGLNDVAEFHYAALGFDWQTGQPALVEVLNKGANYAKFYSQQQMRDLHVGTPLLFKSPDTGQFTLTLGIEKSTTLQEGSFQPFPFSSTGTMINGAGEIEFRFSSPDNAGFFRVGAR